MPTTNLVSSNVSTNQSINQYSQEPCCSPWLPCLWPSCSPPRPLLTPLLAHLALSSSARRVCLPLSITSTVSLLSSMSWHDNSMTSVSNTNYILVMLQTSLKKCHHKDFYYQESAVIILSLPGWRLPALFRVFASLSIPSIAPVGTWF